MKDIDKLDELPKKISMRRTHYKESDDMKIYYQGTQNYKIVSRYIDRYLSKSIGKNYNKIKKHILEKMNNFNVARHDTNLVETYLNGKVSDTKGDTRLKKYIIDSQGRLQINKAEEKNTKYWINKRREKKTTISIDNDNAVIKLRDGLTEKQILLLRTILVDNKINLGGWFHHICCGGCISFEKYNSIITSIKPERKLICRHNYRWYDETFNNREFVDSCFIVTGSFRIYFDDKSDGYKQWRKEAQDKKNKQRRLILKNKEIVNETILHDIEFKRKEKERAKDIVDRDRFGFDDESFKGEFYHGQKRKRNDNSRTT